MRRRKAGDRTYFIDRLREVLLKRMEDDDEGTGDATDEMRTLSHTVLHVCEGLAFTVICSVPEDV
ncbi:hypothetical protein ACIXNO_07440 [Bacteroides fragilis]